MHISIFGAFSAGKKCALYTGKYGIADLVLTKGLWTSLKCLLSPSQLNISPSCIVALGPQYNKHLHIRLNGL